MHAPPNVVCIVAFNDLHGFANDNRAFVATILFKQAEDRIPEGRLQDLFSHDCSSLSAR